MFDLEAGDLNKEIPGLKDSLNDLKNLTLEVSLKDGREITIRDLKSEMKVTYPLFYKIKKKAEECEAYQEVNNTFKAKAIEKITLLSCRAICASFLLVDLVKYIALPGAVTLLMTWLLSLGLVESFDFPFAAYLTFFSWVFINRSLLDTSIRAAVSTEKVVVRGFKFFMKNPWYFLGMVRDEERKLLFGENFFSEEEIALLSAWSLATTRRLKDDNQEDVAFDMLEGLNVLFDNDVDPEKLDEYLVQTISETGHFSVDLHIPNH
jgi:hypothetical protein